MRQVKALGRLVAEGLNHEDSQRCVMRRLKTFIILILGVVVGAAGTYWYAHGPAATSAATEQAASPQENPPKKGRKILYYRNLMGLPDTSPVPKKDPMGMDYIPVYEDEAEEPGTVKVSLDKIQRSGVKTEIIKARTIGPSRS